MLLLQEFGWFLKRRTQEKRKEKELHGLGDVVLKKLRKDERQIGSLQLVEARWQPTDSGSLYGHFTAFKYAGGERPVVIKGHLESERDRACDVVEISQNRFDRQIYVKLEHHRVVFSGERSPRTTELGDMSPKICTTNNSRFSG